MLSAAPKTARRGCFAAWSPAADGFLPSAGSTAKAEPAKQLPQNIRRFPAQGTVLFCDINRRCHRRFSFFAE